MSCHEREAAEITRVKVAKETEKKKRELEGEGSATAQSSKRRRDDGFIRIKMSGETLLSAAATLCSVNGRPITLVEVCQT